jgi:hypothetical protein
VSRRVAPLAVALCGAIAVASAVLLALGPGRQLPGDAFAGAGGASFLMLSLTFGGVGALVAWLRPPDPVTNPERTPGTTEVS